MMHGRLGECRRTEKGQLDDQGQYSWAWETSNYQIDVDNDNDLLASLTRTVTLKEVGALPS